MIYCGREWEAVWLVDTEFRANPGTNPVPICLTARDLVSREEIRLWLYGREDISPPFRSGRDVLFVSYLASAELNCFLALRWPMPTFVLDLYAECRCLFNGLVPPGGFSLASMLQRFGDNFIDSIEKESMRQLAQREGNYSAEEQKALLDYCMRDVLALERLCGHVETFLDGDRALIRGKFMKSVAAIETHGVPLDAQALQLLSRNWGAVRRTFIDRQGKNYPGVFIGGSFCLAGFSAWLADHKIDWPKTSTGKPCADADTFSDMARVYPAIEMLRELMKMLGQLKKLEIAIGRDARNRCMSGVFRSVTGRSQPSNSKWILGAPGWMRGLIRPPRGHALSLLDYKNQELAIAAHFSSDRALLEDLERGDPYMNAAIRAGAAPPGSTKITHAAIRDVYKIATIALLYGIGPTSLAARIGADVPEAERLIAQHKRMYKRFWGWRDAIINEAYAQKRILTPFGWQMHVDRHTSPMTIGNYPMQGGASDVLRLATCFAHDRGLNVAATIHDALLIESTVEDTAQAIAAAQEAMECASEIVLGGFRIFTEVRTIQYPGRMLNSKHERIWALVWEIVREIEGCLPAGILEESING